jgi:hypothetical protein
MARHGEVQHASLRGGGAADILFRLAPAGA